ncbi:MAG TPA: hypothetical protein DEB39_00025, partial [Planctomycetaceae bacterium]|nr:hypothetical protein [Planctomycetaceae bacterium]
MRSISLLIMLLCFSSEYGMSRLEAQEFIPYHEPQVGSTPPESTPPGSMSAARSGSAPERLGVFHHAQSSQVRQLPVAYDHAGESSDSTTWRGRADGGTTDGATTSTIRGRIVDSGVVNSGFVAANDTTGIRQVQATVPSGNVSAEETINAMIGVKYAKIEKPDAIPHDHEQIWRTYDITPYTKNRGFDPASQPEQTIIDWIIRQTGVKTWHGNPVGFLNATPEKILVYHTLEVHRKIADIVDRFVNPNAMAEGYTFRLVSVGQPDWLTRGHAYLRPIPIGTAGVQGWLIDRDNYARFIQDLAKRSDYTEHCPPQILIPNGCLHQVTKKQPRSYLRDVQPSNVAPGYVSDTQAIEEGVHFSFVPLACLDNVASDVMIKLEIQQVERMIPVTIEIPSQDNPRARHRIEAPQMTSVKLDEQIRWPKDRILLLDLGTRPLPDGVGNESKGLAAGFQRTFGGSAGRANYLMFIEKALSPAVP